MARQAVLQAITVTAIFIGGGASSPCLSATVSNTTAKSVAGVTEVGPGLWRGGNPKARGLTRLKGLGVHTIIDLMDEENIESRKCANRLGLQYVNIPLRRTKSIPLDAITQFLAVVNNPAYKPIYVHCRSGRDRTGAMIAIYRISVENWPVSAAYKEMRTYGFNPMFRKLSRSVEEFGKQKVSSVNAE